MVTTKRDERAAEFRAVRNLSGRSVSFVEGSMLMTHRSSLLTALIVASGLAAGAASVHALTMTNRLTYLPFSQPVALPGVTLAAGTYAFELATPNGPNDIVAVRNKART